MSFIEIAKKRYSCRNYSDKQVETDKLEQILEAGHVAPTGANRQPQKIIVVRSRPGMEKLGKAARTYGAPTVMIICSDREATWTRSYDGKKLTDIDASIVTDHMMMEAADLGIDSLWICWFKEEILREEFQIPGNYEIVNLLALGYGNGEAASPERHEETRKPIMEYVTIV